MDLGVFLYGTDWGHGLCTEGVLRWSGPVHHGHWSHGDTPTSNDIWWLLVRSKVSWVMITWEPITGTDVWWPRDIIVYFYTSCYFYFSVENMNVARAKIRDAHTIPISINLVGFGKYEKNVRTLWKLNSNLLLIYKTMQKSRMDRCLSY